MLRWTAIAPTTETTSTHTTSAWYRQTRNGPRPWAATMPAFRNNQNIESGAHFLGVAEREDGTY